MHNSVYRKEEKRDYIEYRMFRLLEEVRFFEKNSGIRSVILSDAFAEHVGC